MGPFFYLGILLWDPFFICRSKGLVGALYRCRVSDPIRDTFILFGSVVGPIKGPVEYDPILWLGIGSKDPRDTRIQGVRMGLYRV